MAQSEYGAAIRADGCDRPEKPGEKALLLRVGMDRGTGGALGPIFRDGTFEYLPIPEQCPTRCRVRYATLPGQHIPSLATVVPARLAGAHPHIDPDFETATYGDAAARKRQQLARLLPGDKLVFYSGLVPSLAEDGPRLFAIGALHVRRIHQMSRRDFGDPDLRRQFGQTAHFLRWPRDEQLVLVEGDPRKSFLLPRARLLGDARDCLLRDLALLGYQGSLRRAVGHWITDGERIRFLEDWLHRGPTTLVGQHTRLVLIADSAIQGKQENGDLVIATRGLHEGDWVMVSPRGQGHVVHTLARINRIAAGERGALGLASFFWRVPTEAGIGSARVALALAAGGTAVSPAMIRQLVASYDRLFRPGFHGGNERLRGVNEPLVEAHGAA